MRGLALLSLLLAGACLAEGGGHCLNPQPDLPCGSADTAPKTGSAGNFNAGPGTETPPAINSGGAYASGGAASINVPGSPPAGGGFGGSSNEAAGAPAEAGAGDEAAGAAGAAGEAGDRGTGPFPDLR